MSQLSKQEIWGPKLTTKSYVLEMKDEDFFAPVYKLPGFSLGAPEAETQDAVMIRTFSIEGGYLREREFYAKKAFNRGFSYELVLPPGAFWTPLGKVANSRGMCRRDFFATALCPEKDSYKHFLRFPDAILDEILPTTMIVATTDDEEAMAEQTTLRSDRRMLYYAMGLNERKQLDTTSPYQPLYAVAFRFKNCQACPLDTHQLAVAGGGDGTAVPLLHKTDDRFATSSTVTNTLAAGSIITGIYTNGDLVIHTFADKDVVNAGTATTGGILISTDGNDTTTVLSSPTDPLYAVTQSNSYYWAVGQGGAIWRSVDATNWEELTNPLAASTLHYTGIAYDKETKYLYLSGYNGTASVAHRIDGDQVTNITTDVNAGNNRLYGVTVLENNHVIFYGQNGVMRENANASAGGTYKTVTVGGTTSTIRWVGGDKARVFAAAGTKVYERSRLTDDIFSAVTANAGTTINGNITGGALGETFEGVNHALIVTDQSEIISIHGYYPNA